jgi:hypothetical protein
VRISLGGVRDEAEIRGHRRTYVGALPGRVIQSLRKAKTRNPVFLLDEVDKVGQDFRGDPSSALLEVLDPEQNHAFSDHYLEVPFDLSQVLFIATANWMDPVPPALKDRMEVIELPGYTEEDKVEIARRYLLPRQREQNGVAGVDLDVTDDTLRALIRSYTREAGVRNLEREIAAVCRKVARKVAEAETGGGPIVVRPEDLAELLGPVQFEPELAERAGRPGVAVGLAWTPAGGDILFVESTRMPGKGGLKLTGSLGDVMRESAEAARSWLRSQVGSVAIDGSVFAESDVHVHVPAGAVPKDGPSAGVAMVTSLASLLTGRIARPLRGDDRRDHAARQGAAGRRHQGEGARGEARRHPRSGAAGAEPARRRRDPEAPPRGRRPLLRRDHRRGSREDARRLMRRAALLAVPLALAGCVTTSAVRRGRRRARSDPRARRPASTRRRRRSPPNAIGSPASSRTSARRATAAVSDAAQQRGDCEARLAERSAKLDELHATYEGLIRDLEGELAKGQHADRAAARGTAYQSARRAALLVGLGGSVARGRARDRRRRQESAARRLCRLPDPRRGTHRRPSRCAVRSRSVIRPTGSSQARAPRAWCARSRTPASTRSGSPRCRAARSSHSSQTTRRRGAPRIAASRSA